MTLRIKLLLSFLLIVALGVSHVSVYRLGNARGTSECQEKTISNMVEASELVKKLAAEASAANVRLGQMISARQQADEQSTQELRDALRTTSAQRVECVLGPDVLRILTTARDRANTAAAAGIAGAVPQNSSAEK